MSQPPKFTRPPSRKQPNPYVANNLTQSQQEEDESISANLYVANCGPAVGVSYTDVVSAFSSFGEVAGVHAADDSGTRVIVCYTSPASARAAAEAWGGGRTCPDLGDRVLHIRYSFPRPPTKGKINDPVSVALDAEQLGIPGIYLIHEFVTKEEELKLLSELDTRPWNKLAKRRVQHYGYEFLYQTRNVDSKQFLGTLPSFVSFLVERLPMFPSISKATGDIVDQLTVNEYRPGVGLAPHVDTHSAFEDAIFSLSLAGSCIMEFRRPSQLKGSPTNGLSASSPFDRKVIFLPPRSMLLMSGEGRYAWQHYIPHHKVDIVGGAPVPRAARRVSFTFRKIRQEPCHCKYSEFCDSQQEQPHSDVIQQ